jgi:hypothetical protein
MYRLTNRKLSFARKIDQVIDSICDTNKNSFSSREGMQCVDRQRCQLTANFGGISEFSSRNSEHNVILNSRVKHLKSFIITLI